MTGNRATRAKLYLEDRKNGMTYREIADKYGVSYQSVHTCCTKVDGTYHIKVNRKNCIYPNLRAWLNADKDRMKRFFQEMKGCSIREYMRGEMQPKKDIIDRMLALTGMTYEVMFAQEE